MTRGPALDVSDLLVRYSDSAGVVTALAIEKWAVASGGLVVVTGPSGSGKSTLLYALAGLLRPTRGSVRWDSTAVDGLNEAARDRWRRQTVGFVFQDFHLMPELTPLQNVTLPATFAALSVSAALKARASALLERFGVPQARKVTASLSRGEQQRVAIARALLFDPPAILADEPTASLDAASGALVADALASFSRDEGRTVIIVSHDPAVIERIDARIVLDHGQALPQATVGGAA